MNIKTWQERYTNCSLEQAMQAEIDELRAARNAEIEALKFDIHRRDQATEVLNACNLRQAAMLAERDALKADAERYRYRRTLYLSNHPLLTEKDMDDATDAAMKGTS